MKDTKKTIAFMFGLTVCLIMLTTIGSYAYYGPGSGRAESVAVIEKLMFTMLGFVIAYSMKDEKL